MPSAQPAVSCRMGRVVTALTSESTNRGWWNVPTRFFPWGRSMAILPPIDESSMESSVVGASTRGIPRTYVEATNPATSPITPPPTATTRCPLSAFISASQWYIFRAPSRVLVSSPPSTSSISESIPALRSDSNARCACPCAPVSPMTNALEGFTTSRTRSPTESRMSQPTQTGYSPEGVRTSRRGPLFHASSVLLSSPKRPRGLDRLTEAQQLNAAIVIAVRQHRQADRTEES